MAVNNRFEISSGGADGYSSTHRSHFSGVSNLERAPSFRDSHDSRQLIQGAGGNFSGSSGLCHGDLQPLSQVLSLDVVSSGEQKFYRQLELRRAINAAVGMSGEDQMHGGVPSKSLEQQAPEELKRVKASLNDNAIRARERSRMLSEAMLKLEKYRASSQNRKRVRPDASVHERPISSLPVERSSTGGNLKASFCASPNHANVADSGTPKPEDKNKAVVPNRRVRTSLVDVRPEGRSNNTGFQRSSGLADRDRDSFKSSSSLGGPMEDKDRIVPNASEGWEKTKMKGRRSGTKSESVIVPPASGLLEAERESKWGGQNRNNSEIRARPPSEGRGFRSGPVQGVISMHKVESSQQNGVAMRSVNRSESDCLPSVVEKGERSVFPEKERPLAKNGVKLSHRDESPLLSPVTVTKAKAARAPRSTSGVLVNPSGYTPRAPSAGVWERAPSKAQLPVGPTNRKRPAPSRSSSPPVAQWVGQRPQKMARIARKMNRAPPVGPAACMDEAVNVGETSSARDVSAIVGARFNPGASPGAGFVRRGVAPATLLQSKPKAERVTPSTVVSESDDSEGGDVKSKEKVKKNGESEVRFAAVNQKMGPLVLLSKKFRVGSKEDGGDGVRRQGRSGRGFVTARDFSMATQVEKLDASASAKQLRSARPGFEKLEKSADVKAPGRPPLKKGTGDRKPLTRPRRPAANGTGDVSGESDDDREELMAAVHEAVNASATACCNIFWKQMEPFFAFLTPDEREGLRKQVRESEEADALLNRSSGNEKGDKTNVVVVIPPENPVVSIVSNVTCMANGSMELDGAMISNIFNKQVVGMDGKKGFRGGWLGKSLPLSQRLLAALIIEGDLVDGTHEDGNKNELLQGCTRDVFSHDLSDSDQAELDKKDRDSESEVETRRRDSRKLNGQSNSFLYDDLSTSNGHRHWDAIPALQKSDLSEGEDVLTHSETDFSNCSTKAEIRKDVERHCLGLKNKGEQSFSSVCGLNSLDFQYQSLKLDDRIALELQSVGLYPDLSDLTAREDDEIAQELKKFQADLNDQVRSNKERLTSLEMAVSNSKATEERDRERLAMLKLAEIAFSKRVGGRGCCSGSSGSKSSTSKGAREAALRFAKRTLARWRHFVEAGQSCFTDVGLKDILFCVSSKDGEGKVPTNGGEVQTGSTPTGLFAPGSSDLMSTASEGTGRLCLLGMKKVDKESFESGQITTMPGERMGEEDDLWLFRPKERQVLLEDVVDSGVVENASLGGTKGKRSERDGKSQCKEIHGRSDTNKSGRQGLGTIKGERKTKTKPRQKTAPLLKAVNGLLGKPAEVQKESAPTLSMTLEKPGADRVMKANDESLPLDLGSVLEAQPEAAATLDLTHLQISSMDDLVVNGDLSGQGQDLGSWLDFEDPGLPDAGGVIMGLDVPMDDLADLTMMM